MRPQTVLLIVAGTLGAGDAVLAQSPEDVARGREAQAQALAAYRAGDMPAFLEAAVRADALRPAHSTLLYNLACARARNGDGVGAIAVLGRLADMGLAFDAGTDPDFAELTGDPDFQGVAGRLSANAAPVGAAETAFGLPWRDFVPEGIARDPASGAFFVSGVRAGQVVRVEDGEVEHFADAPWSALGLAIDPERRILWLGTAAIPETADVDTTEIGRGAVIGLDLDSGQRVAELTFPDDGIEHVPGDLSVAPDGTLFVSDGTAGILWVLRPGSEALEVLAGPDALVSPQGSALSASGRTLWLADYALGILAVDPATGAARRAEQPSNASLLGIDALLVDGEDVIAVQNGVRPARVLRIEADEVAGVLRNWVVLAGGLPAFEEPTGATISGGRLYLIANSHWDRFEDGELADPESLSPPLVLSVGLDSSTVMLEN